MRELVIGDIHGCRTALRTLLNEVRPGPEDTLILLGDYVDRGPDSCGVIDLILELNRRCTVIAIGGNHEKMMLEARDDREMARAWRLHGGRETLDSYRRHGFSGTLEGLPPAHRKFLEEELLDYWETDKRIFVHASVDPNLEMEEQPESLRLWQTFSNPTVHCSGRPIICGHTAQRSGVPAVFHHGICIDTYAYGGGWLTCLETEKDLVTQANEAGEIRLLRVPALADV